MACDKIGVNGSGVRGRVTLWRVDEASGLLTPLHSQRNQIVLSWGHIAARQLGFRPGAGRPSYHISAMYIEYENVGDPEDPATVAVLNSRDFDPDYYYGQLVNSSTQGFVRVPLRIEPTLGISAQTADDYPDYFTDGVNGNQLTFFAQTSNAEVQNAVPFGAAYNSKVYAAALVATPAGDDHTQDVVFARTTFAEANQVTKEASSQIGISWDVAFE
jgi:hypothetical protein